MRREGPKENMKNAFILIKFEKLKLISISPFYQILSGPLNRQDQAHCPVRRPGPRYHGTPQNYLGDLGTQEVDIASRKRGGTTTPL